MMPQKLAFMMLCWLQASPSAMPVRQSCSPQSVKAGMSKSSSAILFQLLEVMHPMLPNRQTDAVADTDVTHNGV